MWATDKWRGLLGFTKSDRLNFNAFMERLHRDDREAIRQKLAEAIKSGGPYEMEYRLELPDGQVRWISSRGHVQSHAGKPVFLRGVSLDITQRKQADDELRQQRNELAHLRAVTTVSELSGSLAHES
jgi:PAS domain S-box-containing protein